MKNLKRVLALVTVLSMVMSVSAFAHVESVTIGDNAPYKNENDAGWKDISGAISYVDARDVPNGTDVTLTLDRPETVANDLDFSDKSYDVTIKAGDDFSGSSLITVEAGGTVSFRDVTIDGNKEVGTVVYVGRGELQIEEGTTITGSAAVPTATWDAGGVCVDSDASLTMNDGKITVEGNSTGGVFNHGTVTVSGGSISATGNDNFGIIDYGSGSTTVNGGSIAVNGGSAVGIEHYSNGNVIIAGGTVSAEGDTISRHGSTTAVLNENNGTITVTGGAITASGEDSAALFNYRGTATVTGGDISANGNDSAAFVNGYSGNSSSSSISGGNFVGAVGSLNGNDKLVITGGVYDDTEIDDYYTEEYTQLTENVGDYVAGEVVLRTALAAEEARLAEDEEARQAAEQEAARQAAEAAYDDSSDDDTPAAPAPVTIEEGATPLAALPEDFTVTEEQATELAVDLGIVEAIEEYVPETVAEHSAVAAVVESLTAGYDNADAAAILAEAGINEGDEVSREQFATVIFALATAQGYDVTARADLSEKFTDAEAVSAFAQEALAWAVEAGIYQGVDVDLLDPQGMLTYEQLILVVSRYLAMVSAQ